MTDRPLTDKQVAALLRAEKGVVSVSGRGCGATISGLFKRNLVDRPHLGAAFDPCYTARLTDLGEQTIAGLRKERER